MINLEVDEGYAFDYLAILAVKKERIDGQREKFHECARNLRMQVGRDLWDVIVASEEYENLIEENRKTFDAVDQARYGSIGAKEVDECNMKRYQAKVAFQKRFFPQKEITEAKN